MIVKHQNRSQKMVTTISLSEALATTKHLGEIHDKVLKLIQEEKDRLWILQHEVADLQQHEYTWQPSPSVKWHHKFTQQPLQTRHRYTHQPPPTEQKQYDFEDNIWPAQHYVPFHNFNFVDERCPLFARLQSIPSTKLPIRQLAQI